MHVLTAHTKAGAKPRYFLVIFLHRLLLLARRLAT